MGGICKNTDIPGYLYKICNTLVMREANNATFT